MKVNKCDKMDESKDGLACVKLSDNHGFIDHAGNGKMPMVQGVISDIIRAFEENNMDYGWLVSDPELKNAFVYRPIFEAIMKECNLNGAYFYYDIFSSGSLQLAPARNFENIAVVEVLANNKIDYGNLTIDDLTPDEYEAFIIDFGKKVGFADKCSSCITALFRPL